MGLVPTSDHQECCSQFKWNFLCTERFIQLYFIYGHTDLKASLMQQHKYMTSPSSVQYTASYKQRCPIIGTYQDEKTQLKESNVLTACWIYLCPEAKHEAIINQSTNRLGPTGISIYSGLARHTQEKINLIDNIYFHFSLRMFKEHVINSFLTSMTFPATFS